MNANAVQVDLAIDGEPTTPDGSIHPHRVPSTGNRGKIKLIQTDLLRYGGSRHKHETNGQEKAATHGLPHGESGSWAGTHLHAMHLSSGSQ
jgi:hypothetical protein